MLHALDIRDAIAARRISELRNAFAALAIGRLQKSWPWGIVVDGSGESVDELIREELLIEVCDELQNCHDIMLVSLCAALHLQQGSTYAEGAAVIMAEE